MKEIHEINRNYNREIIPYVHDLYLHLLFLTLMVVGVSHATNLTMKSKGEGITFSTAWVIPLDVISYRGYPVAQSYRVISPKWTSPLMKKTASLWKDTTWKFNKLHFNMFRDENLNPHQWNERPAKESCCMNFNDGNKFTKASQVRKKTSRWLLPYCQISG